MKAKQVAAERWLVVGCGYVGMRVARRALAAGHVVYALTRSQSRCSALRALGVRPCLGHWLQPDGLIDLPAVDRVLVAVPHRPDDCWSPNGEPIDHQTTLWQHAELAERTHASGLQNLLAAIPSGWTRLVYLSTTGVYGESSQQWIDEQTPLSPTRAGPRIAVAAEQWLAQVLTGQQIVHPITPGQSAPGQSTLKQATPGRSTPGQSYCILRLAGIYGPGRIPLAARLRDGQPLTVPRHGLLNLVHVSDIARMIEVLLTNSSQHSLYLFSDGQPVQRETFYRYLAELCGVSDPVFIQPDGNHPKARRATDKRISPARVLAETGFEFEFPSYRSGLLDALAESKVDS